MQYNYEQLTGISIKDFRNLGTIDIDFTKSAIVCLKGGNEAGKSSVVIALKTLGSNLSSKQYKEYIRTGTDGWVVMLHTADGQSVYRKKTATKQVFGIYKMINGEKKLVWSIDKLDENAVPQEVQQITGFTTEPETKELLNVRTYEDQMLFVETSGGSNYKVMYNALKIDNLTKAVKTGTVEAKEFKQEVDSCETSVNTCKEQLRKIRTLDIEPLQKIKARIQKESQAIVLLERAIEAKRQLDTITANLGILNEIGKLTVLDEYLFNTLTTAYKDKLDLKKIEDRTQTLEEVRGLKLIDTTILDKFETATQVKAKLSKLRTNPYAEVGDCGLVDVVLFDKLNTALQAQRALSSLEGQVQAYSKELTLLDEDLVVKFGKAIEVKGQIQTVESEYQGYRQKIDGFYNQLKAIGVKYYVCPNCGELVLPEEAEHKD